MVPVEIRPPSSAELETWRQLWSGYQCFYKAEIPDEATQETWLRIHDPNEPVWAALAWQGATAVGLVHWIVHRSTWTVGDYCYLQDLFVSPDVRGGGIGRALIARVTTEAQRTGCSRVYWLTHETNTQAMLLYDAVAERSGFVQYRKML